jgi:hypothetical protein
MMENHPLFPRRANIEFCRVNPQGGVDVRVWERGDGETLACGTGACAVTVAGATLGRIPRETDVHLPGGDLVAGRQRGRIASERTAVEIGPVGAGQIRQTQAVIPDGLEQAVAAAEFLVGNGDIVCRGATEAQPLRQDGKAPSRQISARHHQQFRSFHRQNIPFIA